MNVKKTHKFNLIDVVVILVLAALAAAVVFAALSNLGIGGTSVTVRYVLETESLSSDFTSKAAVGDGVFTFDGAESIGKISAVSQAPARHNGYDSEGLPVISEIEGYSILYITVEADAEPRNIGYAVGNTVINTGRDMKIRMPSLYCSARCISVEIVEE